MSADYGWSITKTAVALFGAALIAAAILVPICVAIVTYNSNRDTQKLRLVQACVGSGQSWVSNSCVPVVSP